VPFNYSHIILAHNPEFRSLLSANAKDVVNSIQPLSDFVCDEQGFVQEEEYDAYFQGLSLADFPRTKKPLNDMVTNRQRALIVSHPVWVKELEGRVKAAVPQITSDGNATGGDADGECEESPPKKSRKQVKCANKIFAQQNLTESMKKRSRNAPANIVDRSFAPMPHVKI